MRVNPVETSGKKCIVLQKHAMQNQAFKFCEVCMMRQPLTTISSISIAPLNIPSYYQMSRYYYLALLFKITSFTASLSFQITPTHYASNPHPYSIPLHPTIPPEKDVFCLILYLWYDNGLVFPLGQEGFNQDQYNTLKCQGYLGQAHLKSAATQLKMQRQEFSTGLQLTGLNADRIKDHKRLRSSCSF